MNDHLKQSLDGRLNGMRWGEREQAEVFRLIRQKEVQSVKHVKRGTGILAIAAAMLFFIMGAALAVTGATRPEDTTTLDQPAATEFTPVSLARVENDYITLTVDSADWIGEALTIDLTLRLKEPEKYALVIGHYSNPGTAGRERLTTSLRGECEVGLHDTTRVFAVISSVEVLNMTTDSATLRLTHESLDVDDRETLNVSLTVGAESRAPVFSETVDFTVRRQAAEPVQKQRICLFENELVTGYLVSSHTEGEFLYYTVDVEPRKPWYVINTTAPDKSQLTVSAEWYIGYDDAATLQTGSVYSTEYVATATGARTTTILAFPSAHQTIRFMSHVTARDPLTGAEFESIINASHNRPQTTPALRRSEPTGEHIGGTEQVSVFLEEAWFDGFSAEGRLRIRADDPALCRLALRPNEGSQPSDTTWVVTLADSDPLYTENFTYTMAIEEATGDVIVDFVYCDLHVSGISNPSAPTYGDPNLKYDLTLTVTNEMTWAAETDKVTLDIAPSGDYPLQPLYVLSATDESLLLQGGLITTDRYHYIGLLQPYNSLYNTHCDLLDANGETLASADYVGLNGNSLTLFPRALFPYDGPADTKYQAGVMRLDKAAPLPEPLTLRFRNGDEETGAVVVTPDAARANVVLPEDFDVTLDSKVLFSNPYMTITFVDADFEDGQAIAVLRATLKEAKKYTFDASDSNRQLTYIEPRLTLIDKADPNALQSGTGCFSVVTSRINASAMFIYLYGASETWQEAAPELRAKLAVRNKNDVLESYSVDFTFPAVGEITRYAIAPAEEVVSDSFTFVSGEVVASDGLWVADIRYRCAEPYECAFFRFLSNGVREQSIYSTTYAFSPDASDPTLRQSTLYLAPLWSGSLSALSLSAQDYRSPAKLAEFPITLTPIAE